MNKIIGLSFFLIPLLMGFSAYAQTSQESITTIAHLETSIQDLGYETAVDKALEGGVLTMEQIVKTVLANTTDLNPVQVIAVLTSYGIPRIDIVNAASDAGISAGIVNAGVEKGESMQSASIEKKTPTEEAGLGFGEGLLPIPKPPTIVTGKPGGRDPKDPISPSGRI